MDASEPKKHSSRPAGVTINVNSPNNCIVSGDRIEISINMGEHCEEQPIGQLMRVGGVSPAGK